MFSVRIQEHEITLSDPFDYSVAQRTVNDFPETAPDYFMIVQRIAILTYVIYVIKALMKGRDKGRDTTA